MRNLLPIAALAALIGTLAACGSADVLPQTRLQKTPLSHRYPSNTGKRSTGKSPIMPDVVPTPSPPDSGGSMPG